MRDQEPPPLLLWMKLLLRFAGTFNLLAGLGMICLYHEGYRMLGAASQPASALAAQVMGCLVGLFGIGYHWVAGRPVENRNLLVLGWWSKALGSLAALPYILTGKLPWWFGAVVFFADVIYLPPFYLILRRLGRIGRAS